MRVERVQIAEIERNWHWIYQLLEPVVDQGETRNMQQIKRGLMSGMMGLASAHVPNGAALVIVEPGTFDGVFCCWITCLTGEVRGGFKSFIKVSRQLMTYFELSARLAGCTEMRIGGRNWARVFPDYERFDCIVPNSLRKRL